MALETLTFGKDLLGRSVIYTDGQGKRKAARIIGTPDSVQAGTPVTPPKEDTVILEITAPDGSKHTRRDIPRGDGPRTWSAR